MTWDLETSPEFQGDYRKHCRKNAAFRAAVDKKVAQMAENPLRYQPLKPPLAGVRRVHVAGSFVILFEPDRSRKTIRLLRLAHHDEAYGI